MIRQIRIFKIILNCFIFLFCINHLNAQEVANQMWFEYRPTYNFNPKFKVDMRFSFRDEFDESNWHTWEVRAIPVYKLSKRFDVNFGISFLETTQNIQLTTSEIRFAPGLRYHVPWERIELGAWARVELRSVYDKQLDEWTYTTRPRLRIFTDIPINAKSMKEENFVYVSSFAEFFYQNDEDLQERYAKRYWFRLGLGYKLNQNWRFEFLYNRQDSKNTIDQSLADTTKENIFVLAVRHKIN